MIERREAIGLGLVGFGIFAANAASACSFTATRRPVPFRDGTCASKIRQFVAFANVIHTKTDDEISDWEEKTGLSPYYDGNEWDSANLLKCLRISDGKLDPKPIKIGELELIRQKRNRATYVVTLLRNQYFAADEEGCNGLFTHEEFFADTEKAYLAVFENNEFRALRDFPEWYV